MSDAVSGHVSSAADSAPGSSNSRFAARPLEIDGVKLIVPAVISDDRGSFVEVWRASEFRRWGVPDLVQDNQALSLRRGTLRGLHFQRPPHAQAKLVRVLAGAIFDVAVDLRPDSPTFAAWAGATLTAAGGEQMYVPAGFAHGYCTLEPETVVHYRCSAYYRPESEGGIVFDDPDVGIAWPVPADEMTIGTRDRALPRLRQVQATMNRGNQA